MNYLIIAGSSACVYIFIVVALRLFGKKEIAQLSMVDLVFVLLISNAVQNAMVGPDTSLLGGLCAAATLFVVNYIFKGILYKSPKISGLVQGHEVMLIYDGKIIEENLAKTKISLVELHEAIREHGVHKVEDVNLAVLEVDGNISILSNDYQSHSKHMKIHKTKQRRKGQSVE